MAKVVKKYKGESKYADLTVRICARCLKQKVTRKIAVRKQIDRKLRVEDVCYECIPMGPTPGIKVITRLADNSDIEELDTKLMHIEELIYKLGASLEVKKRKKKKKGKKS